MSPAKRPTIADIAEAAGVSKGAVSYALNGKTGVSEQTRARILEIAARMGWHPSSAARALSDGRAGAIGLVVDRPAWVLGIEPFFMQLISGVEAELAATGTALLLQVTEDAAAEEAAYRRWWGERRVDGVLLVDLREDDPRLALLDELGLPAVLVGHAPDAPKVPSVWINDGAAVRETLAYLTAMGHRRIARVAGPPRFVHTRERGEVFDATAAELGLDGVTCVHTDYSGADGARATRRLLSGPDRPDRGGLRQRRDGRGRTERHPGDGRVRTRRTVRRRLGRQRVVPPGAPRAHRRQPPGAGVRRAGRRVAARARRRPGRTGRPAPAAGARTARQYGAGPPPLSRDPASPGRRTGRTAPPPGADRFPRSRPIRRRSPP